MTWVSITTLHSLRVFFSAYASAAPRKFFCFSSNSSDTMTKLECAHTHVSTHPATTETHLRSYRNQFYKQNVRLIIQSTCYNTNPIKVLILLPMVPTWHPCMCTFVYVSGNRRNRHMEPTGSSESRVVFIHPNTRTLPINLTSCIFPIFFLYWEFSQVISSYRMRCALESPYRSGSKPTR